VLRSFPKVSSERGLHFNTRQGVLLITTHPRTDILARLTQPDSRARLGIEISLHIANGILLRIARDAIEVTGLRRPGAFDCRTAMIIAAVAITAIALVCMAVSIIRLAGLITQAIPASRPEAESQGETTRDRDARDDGALSSQDH
jgi:hypothetical protein